MSLETAKKELKIGNTENGRIDLCLQSGDAF